MAKNNSRQQDFPDCTYGNLRRIGFMPQQDLMARKTLATAEQGKKYTLDISGNKESAAFDVDGYIVKKGSKCDKLVLVKHSEDNWTEIFVELKGCKICYRTAKGNLKKGCVQAFFKQGCTCKDSCGFISGKQIESGNGECEKGICRKTLFL